jgi:hypothetical protein
MTLSMRQRVEQTDWAAVRAVAFDAVLATVALFVMGWLRLRPGLDWREEAQPAVHALLAGHVHSFFTLAPIYGASLLLRAPFLLATKLSHSGDLAVYRASAIPCLMATGALGVWLSGQMRAKGSSTIARVLVLLVCVANPLIMWALKWGHPEELLSAACCVAAMLCALRGRTIAAAILLGLAIANKEWALLAAGPVLVALPGARIRTLVIAGGVAAALLAPFTLANAGFAGQVGAVGTSTGAIFHPWQIWWFFGSVPHAHPGLFIIDPNFVYRLPPSWLGGLGHSLVVVLMPVLTALYALVRRPWGARARHDALLLLALLLALRCMLDPWDISYYWLPFLFAMLAWEVVATRRAPMMSLVATALVAWTLQNHFAFDTQAAVFLAVGVPSLIALAVGVYAPNVGQRVLAASRRGLAPPAAAAASS